MTAQLKLYDNSRISDFKRCPRYFLFRHVYNLTQEGRAVPLTFGSCWHASLEVLWAQHADLYGSKEKRRAVIDASYQAFIDEWIKAGMTSPDEMGPDEIEELGARTPMMALEMLHNYVDARQHLFTDSGFELLSIEEPFIVPLDPDDASLFYVGRLDKKFRWRSQINAMEHKSTTLWYKKQKSFRSTWIESWSPNSQIDGYQYALLVTHGEQAGGVWIDGAALADDPKGFKIIPIDRQTEHLDAWLWETHNWIDEIEANKAVLEERSSPSHPYMAAFKKNTNSCISYERSCPFLDLCRMHANPARLEGIPIGYKYEHWSPFSVINLEKIGITPEAAGEIVP